MLKTKIRMTRRFRGRVCCTRSRRHTEHCPGWGLLNLSSTANTPRPLAAHRAFLSAFPAFRFRLLWWLISPIRHCQRVLQLCVPSASMWAHNFQIGSAQSFQSGCSPALSAIWLSALETKGSHMTTPSRNRSPAGEWARTAFYLSQVQFLEKSAKAAAMVHH